MRGSRKHKKRRRIAVDLFPFLGIIVCVIGVLVLLISGLAAAGGIQEQAILEKARLDSLLALVDRLIAADRSIQATPAQKTVAQTTIDAEKAKIAELARARKQLADLEKQLNAALAAIETKRKDLSQVNVSIAALKQETDALKLRIARAEKDADQAEHDNLVTFPTRELKIKPVYIECFEGGLTITKIVNGKIDVQNIGLGDIKEGYKFAGLVDDVAMSAKRGEGDVLNLLVRPNGVEAYDDALGVIGKRKAPYASVPVTVPGKIRFRDPERPEPSN